MRPLIPVPTKGEKLRATWGTQVSNRLNELCAMAPSGVLHREGFGGIGDQPLPKNLRDRPAGASQPMPFDLAASVETSQDGTQKRLVVKWFYGGNPAWPIAAAVSWNYWALTPPTSGDPAPTVDAFGYITAYTGEWQTAENFADDATIELWFTLQVTPSWSSSPTFSVSGSWEVMESGAHDLTDLRLDPTGVTQTLVSYVVLGTALATSGSSVKVAQAFHGDLHLNDLLCINGGGGGGGTPDQQGSQSGCWKIATVENQGATSKQLQDCYYNVGGITKQAANQAVPANATGYLCAVFSASGVTVAVYASLDSIQADESKYVVPLYEMNAGEVLLDMRNAPQIQVFEETL